MLKKNSLFQYALGVFYRRVWRPLILLIIYYKPSFVDIQSLKIYDADGDLPFKNGANICFFAHFDIHGQVAQYVLDHLKILKKMNFDIIFVSTGLSIEYIDALKSLCAKIIIRKNIGLDFVSWKLGFSYLPKKRMHKNILLLNDSVIGPVESYLKKVFEFYYEESIDVLGLTESKPQTRKRYHLQSYFLFFNSNLFDEKWMQKFWKNIKVVKNKDFIINYYEIGFTQVLLKNRVNLKSFISYEKVVEYFDNIFQKHKSEIDTKRGINLTIHTWDIITQAPFYFPYIKREVLIKKLFNPDKVSNWKSFISIDNSHLVDKYLNRVERLM